MQSSEACARRLFKAFTVTVKTWKKPHKGPGLGEYPDKTVHSSGNPNRVLRNGGFCQLAGRVGFGGDDLHCRERAALDTKEKIFLSLVSVPVSPRAHPQPPEHLAVI